MKENALKDGGYNERLVYLDELLKRLTEKVDMHITKVSEFDRSVCSLKEQKGPGKAEAKDTPKEVTAQ